MASSDRSAPQQGRLRDPWPKHASFTRARSPARKTVRDSTNEGYPARLRRKAPVCGRFPECASREARAPLEPSAKRRVTQVGGRSTKSSAGPKPANGAYPARHGGKTSVCERFRRRTSAKSPSRAQGELTNPLFTKEKPVTCAQRPDRREAQMTAARPDKREGESRQRTREHPDAENRAESRRVESGSKT